MIIDKKTLLTNLHSNELYSSALNVLQTNEEKQQIEIFLNSLIDKICDVDSKENKVIEKIEK